MDQCILQQLNGIRTHEMARNRHREREELSEQLTALKSLLRLDADGIGDQSDLLNILEKTHQSIDRFSCSLRAEIPDFSMALTPILDSSLCKSEVVGLALTKDASRKISMESSRESVVSVSSSTQSSSRSSPSAISTTATSISPRESLLSRSLSSPRVFGSPSPSSYPGYFREEDLELCDDEAILTEDKCYIEDFNEPSDASFERLSSILAALQQQAEAAVFSPSFSEDEEILGLWPGAEPQFSSASTKTVTNTQSVQSVTTTTVLTPTNISRMGSSVSTLSLPKIQTGTSMVPLSPSTMPLPTLAKRFSGPGPDQKSFESAAESKELEFDIEKLLAEFLDERLCLGYGEQDFMFRWVWIYFMGAGLLWVAVGWILRWGCSCQVGEG